MKELTLYKWIMFVTILIVTFIFAILPVVWKKFRGSEFWLSMANSFSGGLFLACGIVHILPEANERMEAFYKGKDGYPWPFLAAAGSYSIVL